MNEKVRNNIFINIEKITIDNIASQLLNGNREIQKMLRIKGYIWWRPCYNCKYHAESFVPKYTRSHWSLHSSEINTLQGWRDFLFQKIPLWKFPVCEDCSGEFERVVLVRNWGTSFCKGRTQGRPCGDFL